MMTSDEWLVLLPNHCSAYISPEQYERNQERLQANRARADAMGAARSGAALLAGLVVCARCSCRLSVHYESDGHLHAYECVERHTHYGEPHDAGYCPAHTTHFRAQTIREVQRRLGVRAPRPRVRQRAELRPDEWWPAELVRVLDIPRASLYHWIRHGLVRARQLDEPLHRWVVWADETEQERLRQYHQRAIRDDFRRRWTNEQLVEQP